METKVISSVNIDQAAECIKMGGTVVFPTETVYGLGADAFNDEAIMKIFKAKNRPADNPLIVHISDMSDLERLTQNICERAKVLAEKFWPGPVTMILNKLPEVSALVTAGLDTVAVRFPSNKLAQNLIKKSGTLIAAPSANLSGSPSPTVCEDVIDDLDGRVDYIIDGTGCEIGLESTVVDVSGDDTVILRPGAITLEMIQEFIPDATLDKGLTDTHIKPKCPGLKYTHYSPKAEVVVVQGEKEKVREYILKKLETEKAGVITYKGGNYDNALLVLDAGENMTEYAHNLFSYLRLFDKANVKKIYAEFVNEDGMGTAVRNRLYKSAGHMVVEV